MSIQNHPDLSHLITIVKEAGVITQSYFQKHFHVDEKAHNQGIVTEADYASEKAIVEYIRKNFPSHLILAEESGTHGNLSEKEQPLWVIDPIDGTTNFSKGNPYHCISIAYGMATIDCYKPLLGVVMQPTTGKIFSAQKEKGVFLDGQKVTISHIDEPHLACIATGFASAKGEKLKKVVQSIFEMQNMFLGTRINGAAALDLALTATGPLQGFYERDLAPWDMAAGYLMVQEAGGIVTNFQGQPFELMRDKDIIACHQSLHPYLLNAVQKSFY